MGCRRYDTWDKFLKYMIKKFKNISHFRSFANIYSGCAQGTFLTENIPTNS
jgi:hypothetical protein